MRRKVDCCPVRRWPPLGGGGCRRASARFGGDFGDRDVDDRGQPVIGARPGQHDRTAQAEPDGADPARSAPPDLRWGASVSTTPPRAAAAPGRRKSGDLLRGAQGHRRRADPVPVRHRPLHRRAVPGAVGVVDGQIAARCQRCTAPRSGLAAPLARARRARALRGGRSSSGQSTARGRWARRTGPVVLGTRLASSRCPRQDRPSAPFGSASPSLDPDTTHLAGAPARTRGQTRTCAWIGGTPPLAPHRKTGGRAAGLSEPGSNRGSSARSYCLTIASPVEV
jgi:hypothetical protein